MIMMIPDRCGVRCDWVLDEPCRSVTIINILMLKYIQCIEYIYIYIYTHTHIFIHICST